MQTNIILFPSYKLLLIVDMYKILILIPIIYMYIKVKVTYSLIKHEISETTRPKKMKFIWLIGLKVVTIKSNNYYYVIWA